MKPEQRNKPEALDHVFYEFKMLHATGLRLSEGISPGERHNVYLESFLIHARCIVEFFCNPNAGYNKMKPCHFVPDYALQSVEDKLKRRIDHEVAHLTYDRKKPGELGNWPIREVAFPLYSLGLHFFQAIQSNDELMAFANNRAETEELIQTFEKELSASKVPGVHQESVGASSPVTMATMGPIPASTSGALPPNGGQLIYLGRKNQPPEAGHTAPPAGMPQGPADFRLPSAARLAPRSRVAGGLDRRTHRVNVEGWWPLPRYSPKGSQPPLRIGAASGAQGTCSLVSPRSFCFRSCQDPAPACSVLQLLCHGYRHERILRQTHLPN